MFNLNVGPSLADLDALRVEILIWKVQFCHLLRTRYLVPWPKKLFEEHRINQQPITLIKSDQNLDYVVFLLQTLAMNFDARLEIFQDKMPKVSSKHTGIFKII